MRQLDNLFHGSTSSQSLLGNASNVQQTTAEQSKNNYSYIHQLSDELSQLVDQMENSIASYQHRIDRPEYDDRFALVQPTPPRFVSPIAGNHRGKLISPTFKKETITATTTTTTTPLKASPMSIDSPADNQVLTTPITRPNRSVTTITTSYNPPGILSDHNHQIRRMDQKIEHTISEESFKTPVRTIAASGKSLPLKTPQPQLSERTSVTHITTEQFDEDEALLSELEDYVRQEKLRGR
jgi:hypothetical protein